MAGSGPPAVPSILAAHRGTVAAVQACQAINPALTTLLHPCRDRNVHVTLPQGTMDMQPRTAAERYLQARLANAEYADAHGRARRQIDTADAVLRALDRRRRALGMSKAELARRAGLQPEVVRRLFVSKTANPTLRTLSAIADALHMDLRPTPVDEKGRCAGH